MTKLQKRVLNRIKVVVIIIVFVGMSLAIYVLYGMKISMEREFSDTKADLDTAIKLLYRCEKVVDENNLNSTY